MSAHAVDANAEMQRFATGLAEVEDQVLDRACGALGRRSEPRYTSGDARQKLRGLYETLVESIERGDGRIVASYVERVAEDQVGFSFDIAEVQTIFNVLEEALWAQGLATLEGDERIRAVEAVSLALRAGRDAVARVYVALSRSGGRSSGDDGREAGAPCVGREVRDDVGILTLQDEGRRNAIGSQMAGEIISGLGWFGARDVRAVVLRAGPGVGVWSAGHDIDELPHGRRDPLAYNDPLEQCVRAVRMSRLPVIAMIHGSVWGGAFDLVLSCDVVVADETATFAITPANLGLPYNTTGLLHFLGRLPVNVVKEMFFTAQPIDARQAERWMVVNHLVPAAELENFTLDLATTMASKAPLAIAAVKEQLRVLSDYQPIAAQVYERIQDLRREAYDSADYLEGLAAFAERRCPQFKGL